MAERTVFVAGDETEIVVPMVDAETDEPFDDIQAATLVWRISHGAKVNSSMTLDGTRVRYRFTSNQLVKGMLKYQVRVQDLQGYWFTSQETFTVEVLDSL